MATELKKARTINEMGFIELGEKVWKKREAKGLSLREVSEASGLSLHYIHLIENGRVNPSIDKIVALADVLETSASWLVQHLGKGNPKKKSKSKAKSKAKSNKPKDDKKDEQKSTEEALGAILAPRLTDQQPTA